MQHKVLVKQQSISNTIDTNIEIVVINFLFIIYIPLDKYFSIDDKSIFSGYANPVGFFPYQTLGSFLLPDFIKAIPPPLIVPSPAPLALFLE